MRRLRAGACLLAATLALTACGGGSHQGSATPTPFPALPPDFPSPSAAPPGYTQQPGMPAIIANATDFTKEPKIAEGTAPTPLDLVVRDLIVGTGAEATASDTVNLRYEGAVYSDGKVFDASWKQGPAPTNFALPTMGPGLGGGIVGMKIGGRREIVVPAFMAYGSDSPAGSGIPANSALVFVVDLVGIGAPPQAPGNVPVLPTPSSAPAGAGALPGIPAITANATDLTKEPKIARGTGSASTALVIRDLVVGTGKVALASDSVNVRYEGALFSDGSVFDASWKNGPAPVPFALTGVVPGFGGGIVGMKIGGRREIVIPASMGYGSDSSTPGIPPNSVLVFVVDLVGLG
ncbi:MAG TPA: FKBP-type peptidyl-prolyl cis-trans isomerase [Sporichthyaceae bacterium]|nr:FKBP-type peptidyl-prolyl cis-trans isomerase [Sporichthyaceae bacterium]